MIAHKQFGIHVQCHNNLTSHMCLNSKEVALLRQEILLIWDESSMAHKDMLSSLDFLLQDLMSNNLNVPFGGNALSLEMISGHVFQ
jgi:hypothetical protein